MDAARLGDFLKMGHLAWWSGVIYNLCHSLIKFSYLAFYLSLMPDRKSRLAVYAMIAFIVAVGVTFTTLTIFWCTPVRRAWEFTVPGTCKVVFLFSNAAFNMVADVIVFLLPIPTLWSLHCKEGPKSSQYCHTMTADIGRHHSTPKTAPDIDRHVHLRFHVSLLPFKLIA